MVGGWSVDFIIDSCLDKLLISFDVYWSEPTIFLASVGGCVEFGLCASLSTGPHNLEAILKVMRSNICSPAVVQDATSYCSASVKDEVRDAQG